MVFYMTIHLNMLQTFWEVFFSLLANTLKELVYNRYIYIYIDI